MASDDSRSPWLPVEPPEQPDGSNAASPSSEPAAPQAPAAPDHVPDAHRQAPTPPANPYAPPAMPWVSQEWSAPAAPEAPFAGHAAEESLARPDAPAPSTGQIPLARHPHASEPDAPFTPRASLRQFAQSNPAAEPFAARVEPEPAAPEPAAPEPATPSSPFPMPPHEPASVAPEPVHSEQEHPEQAHPEPPAPVGRAPFTAPTPTPAWAPVAPPQDDAGALADAATDATPAVARMPFADRFTEPNTGAAPAVAPEPPSGPDGPFTPLSGPTASAADDAGDQAHQPDQGDQAPTAPAPPRSPYLSAERPQASGSHSVYQPQQRSASPEEAWSSPAVPSVEPATERSAPEAAGLDESMPTPSRPMVPGTGAIPRVYPAAYAPEPAHEQAHQPPHELTHEPATGPAPESSPEREPEPRPEPTPEPQPTQQPAPEPAPEPAPTPEPTSPWRGLLPEPIDVDDDGDADVVAPVEPPPASEIMPSYRPALDSGSVPQAPVTPSAGVPSTDAFHPEPVDPVRELGATAVSNASLQAAGAPTPASGVHLPQDEDVPGFGEEQPFVPRFEPFAGVTPAPAPSVSFQTPTPRPVSPLSDLSLPESDEPAYMPRVAPEDPDRTHTVADEPASAAEAPTLAPEDPDASNGDFLPRGPGPATPLGGWPFRQTGEGDYAQAGGAEETAASAPADARAYEPDGAHMPQDAGRAGREFEAQDAADEYPSGTALHLPPARRSPHAPPHHEVEDAPFTPLAPAGFDDILAESDHAPTAGIGTGPSMPWASVLNGEPEHKLTDEPNAAEPEDAAGQAAAPYDAASHEPVTDVYPIHDADAPALGRQDPSDEPPRVEPTQPRPAPYGAFGAAFAAESAGSESAGSESAPTEPVAAPTVPFGAPGVVGAGPDTASDGMRVRVPGAGAARAGLGGDQGSDEPGGFASPGEDHHDDHQSHEEGAIGSPRPDGDVAPQRTRRGRRIALIVALAVIAAAAIGVVVYRMFLLPDPIILPTPTVTVDPATPTADPVEYEDPTTFLAAIPRVVGTDVLVAYESIDPLGDTSLPARAAEHYSLEYGPGPGDTTYTVEAFQHYTEDEAQQAYDAYTDGATDGEDIVVDGTVVGQRATTSDADGDHIVWRNGTAVFVLTGPGADLQHFYDRFGV